MITINGLQVRRIFKCIVHLQIAVKPIEVFGCLLYGTYMTAVGDVCVLDCVVCSVFP
jgi:hypothetical protein